MKRLKDAEMDTPNKLIRALKRVKRWESEKPDISWQAVFSDLSEIARTGPKPPK